MRSILIALLVTVFYVPICAQKSTDDFSGYWTAPKGDTITVNKTNEGFIGKTVKEGAVVLKDVKFHKGKWLAVIMNPREKLIANCELILETGKIKIIAKKGLLYKTLYWKKV